MKKYLIITLVISTLLGMILPLILGVKDLTLIAISFTLVWFIYATVLLIVTFVAKPGLRIKEIRDTSHILTLHDIIMMEV